MICYRVPKQRNHTRKKIEDLLKALLKNGLKCFQRNVSYSGNNSNIWEALFLLNKSLCETIKGYISRNLQFTVHYYNYKLQSFVGMVDFLGLFCPELQKFLK